MICFSYAFLKTKMFRACYFVILHAIYILNLLVNFKLKTDSLHFWTFSVLFNIKLSILLARSTFLLINIVIVVCSWNA